MKSKNTHENFYIITAKSNFELGLSLGKNFKREAQSAAGDAQKGPDWILRRRQAEKYLGLTEKFFGQYVDELQGYARGAGVDFLDLWALALILGGEVGQNVKDRCTTIITNQGKLISHNEDWEEASQNSVYVLLKTVRDVTIFELFFANTLGGDSISINSNGFVSSASSLGHIGPRIGIPRNVIVRWLSETKNPSKDARILRKIPRGLGYSVTFANTRGGLWNIEYTREKLVCATPKPPYVHTNHFLSPRLRAAMLSDNSTGTFDRYKFATANVRSQMTVPEILKLTSDESLGKVRSIMNERTIARVIVDLDRVIAKVWLRREDEKGWVDYNLKELLG